MDRSVSKELRPKISYCDTGFPCPLIVSGIHIAPREVLPIGNSLPDELVNQKLQLLLFFDLTPILPGFRRIGISDIN